MPTLNWIGKEGHRQHHRHVPYRLLHCDKSKSARDPDSGNLLVQDVNLETLKTLPPYYAGKGKCIYTSIRPTTPATKAGSTMTTTTARRLKKWLGQVVGKEAEHFARCDKCLMYWRLALSYPTVTSSVRSARIKG